MLRLGEQEISGLYLGGGKIGKAYLGEATVFGEADWQVAELPSFANWDGITYGGGKFVAVAGGGTNAAYSEDGINWTAASLPISANWRNGAYGAGKFVVVASNSDKAAYSTNGGATWIAADLPASANWRAVAYDDGIERFVAVAGDGATVAYSTDGINWTAATLPSDSFWSDVIGCGGTFVAVAYGSADAAYSTDGGATWTAATLPLYAGWAGLASGGGKFVAVAGVSTDAAYSADGINWTAATLPSYADWSGLGYVDGEFVAVASGGTTAAYSTDGGATWMADTLPLAGGWYNIAGGGGKVVAVAYGSSKAVYRSAGKKKPSRLPEGYTEVEYIQSDTHCSISTGLSYSTAQEYNNSRMVIDFTPVSIEGEAVSLGRKIFTSSMAQGNGTQRYFSSSQFRDGAMNFFVGTTSLSMAVAPNERHILDVDIRSAVVKIDSESKQISRGTTTVSVFRPGIFADKTSDSVKAKMFGCQIYEGDAMVRDFVPCLDPSGAVGLYDLVGGNFYGNVGAGTFTAGPAV